MLARPRIASRLLAVVTALALAFAPAFPAFAHTGGPDAPAAQTAAAHTHHAHDGHGEPLKASPCSLHDGCSGQCCATCAQCFTAAPALAPPLSPSHAVRNATAGRLHTLLLVAPHNRPPQTL